MASSSVVIKVKYGKTLRRFSALVNEDQYLDLDMERLRTKIFSLFNFSPDANFTLTYTDEDEDQVTLADDEDLYDITRQGLNPIRITVLLNVEKGAQSSPKIGSSTPKGPSSQNCQDKIPCVAEILKSVPEPLCDVLSKLSLELASKTATTSPVLAELITNLSKVGQSCLNACQFPCDTASGSATVSTNEVCDDKQNTSASEKHGASVDEKIKVVGSQVPTSEQLATTTGQGVEAHAVKGARGSEPLRAPQHPSIFFRKGKNGDSGHFRHMLPMGEFIKEEVAQDSGECNTNSTGLPTTGSRKKDKEVEGYSAWKSGVNMSELVKTHLKHVSSKKHANEAYNTGKKGFNRGESSSKSGKDQYSMGECPFSGAPLQSTLGHVPYRPPPIQPFKRSFSDSTDGFGSIFHKGVRCDGCGVLPITGPRFKSKVKHDYDLCSICFSQMGNDADYARIDFPLPYRHSWTFKGFHDPIIHLPSMQIPSVWRPYGAKHLRSRFDSRFIIDVNVMDGTLMAPSTPFTKIWKMQNNGTLPWVRGLQLLWIGGDRFSASDSFEIEIPVEGVNVGGELDVAIDFVAPELPGRYISYWRMADSAGHKFGQRVWVLIQVDASLKDTESESSPFLKSDLPSGNAGSSAHANSSVVDLNLPRGNEGWSAYESPPTENSNLDVNVEPAEDVVAADLGPAPEGGNPSKTEGKSKIEIVDMNFPINDDLLVASDGSRPITTVSSSHPSSFGHDNPIYPVAAAEFASEEAVLSIQQKPASDISSPHAASSSSMPSPLFRGSYPVFDADVPRIPESGPHVASSSSMPSPRIAEKPVFPNPFQFSYPVVDVDVPHIPASGSPSVSYPIIDMSEKSSAASSSSSAATKYDGEETNGGKVSGVNEVEERLLKELEGMGFKQVERNREVLRLNTYDLERSVDELCGVSEWDPILEELQEMGFQDKETNKKLLVKNNGSITRVVLDLIASEDARN